MITLAKSAGSLHRTDGRTVCMDAYQPHADPIVAVARIFEMPERMAVAWNRAADGVSAGLR